MSRFPEIIGAPEGCSQQALGLELQFYLSQRSFIYSEDDGGLLQAEHQEGLGLRRAQANFDLLEDIGCGEAVTEPAASICVPVAILREDEETVLRAISTIKKASVVSGKPVEIIMWANAANDGTEQIAHAANNSYDSLRQKLAVVSDEHCRVRTALQLLPPPEATMSTVRANMMDAVALDASKRGFSFEHPVLWLDADTTFVNGKGFSAWLDRICKLDALFVHADLQQSIDWADGKGLEDLDDISKAIAIREIVRRMDARFAEGDRMTHGYVEESGLGFSLGTYLWTGGVSTLYAINESKTVMDRARFRLEENGLPQYVKTKLSLVRVYGWPQMIVRVPEARVGTSARRYPAVVRAKGLEVLRDIGTATYTEELGLFTQLSNESPQAALQRVLRSEMETLLGIKRQPLRELLGPYYFNDDRNKRWERRQRLAAVLVDRYFDA